VGVSKYETDVDLAHESNTSHWHVGDLIGSGKRVLDVGCSTGYFAAALAARGNEVLGVEYDEASAEAARSRGIEVLVADLETTDLAAHFGEASFDVVVYADVLEHLRDPLPVLRATHRLLRPGGFVVVSLPNVAHGDIRMALLEGRFDYTDTGILDTTHTRFFTRRTLTRLIHEAGFAVAELRRTTAGLFQTEQGLDPRAADPAVVEHLLSDPESTTYQFVAKVVVDDAGAATLGQAEELYETRIERDRLVDEVARLRVRLSDLEGVVGQANAAREQAEQNATSAIAQLDELRTRLGQVTQDLGRVRSARRRLREELDRLGSQRGGRRR
jgi:methionine biosynthesis protein MetW